MQAKQTKRDEIISRPFLRSLVQTFSLDPFAQPTSPVPAKVVTTRSDGSPLSCSSTKRAASFSLPTSVDPPLLPGEMRRKQLRKESTTITWWLRSMHNPDGLSKVASCKASPSALCWVSTFRPAHRSTRTAVRTRKRETSQNKEGKEDAIPLAKSKRYSATIFRSSKGTNGRERSNHFTIDGRDTANETNTTNCQHVLQFGSERVNEHTVLRHFPDRVVQCITHIHRHISVQLRVDGQSSRQ